jgi:hypothetical protein
MRTAIRLLWLVVVAQVRQGYWDGIIPLGNLADGSLELVADQADDFTVTMDN